MKRNFCVCRFHKLEDDARQRQSARQIQEDFDRREPSKAILIQQKFFLASNSSVKHLNFSQTHFLPQLAPFARLQIVLNVKMFTASERHKKS